MLNSIFNVKRLIMKKKRCNFCHLSLTQFQKLKGLKLGVMFIVLIAMSITTYAQTKQISGTVQDNEGKNLPGVTVLVKGTTRGAVTDYEGKYVIDGVAATDTLMFSSIGMITQQVAVGSRTVINITMETDIEQLEEVVVTGYSSAKRKNLTSAVTQLNNKEITGLVVTDVRESVQGKIAGVQVVSNNGDPGSGSRIVIRGMGSFTNTEPLYVIDGMQGGDINSIPQNEIASITILKDAATTAIYGSAGANGVVIITTKNGKKGKVNVDYNGTVGMSVFNKRYDMLNAGDYIDLVKDIQETNGLELSDKLKDPASRVDRTDWQEAIFRTGLVTDHNLSISGKANYVDYVFAAGYQYEQSTVIDRDFQRLSLNMKLNEKLFKNHLRLGQSIRFKQDTHDGVLANFVDALRMPPYLPIYDENNLGGYSKTDKPTDLQDARNPYNSVYNSDYNNINYSLNVDLYGEVDIFEGLKLRSQARISQSNGNSNTFNHPSLTGNGPVATSMTESFYVWKSFFWENFFSYSHTFGANTISATLGMSYQPAGSYRSLSAAGSDYVSDAVQNISLANTKDVTSAYVNSGKSRLSYFANLNYTFKNRYDLSGSFRRDASSVFGENNRWGNFYGFGGGWILSEEGFLNGSSFVNFLKLRGSYGKTGNDNIPGFLTSSTVWKGWSNNIVYSFGDAGFHSGATINSVPNPNLKWEETTQFDIGLDFRTFAQHLDITLDYYQRNNEDLLIQTVLPLSTGLGLPSESGTQWVNAASMKNNGLEMSLTYKNSSSREFRWSISGNATYNVNEVTDLGTVGDAPISAGQFMDGVGNATRTDIGHPIGSFFGYMVDHVAVDQAEVDKLNQHAIDASDGAVSEYIPNLKPGDFIFKDVDGNGWVDTEDRTFIGNPNPKWQYGFTFNADFKGFDFQIFLQGVAGVDVVNGGRYWLEGMSKPFNSSAATLNRWKKEGDVAELPRAGQNSGTNLQFSDWYVESGDYLKLRNITLGYNFFSNRRSNVFNKIRIYVAIQNAFTITSYSGYDPEISTIYPYNNKYQTFARGIDYFSRPNPTIYRFGAQITF